MSDAHFSFDESSVSPPVVRRENDAKPHVEVVNLASKELKITLPDGEEFRVKKGSKVRYSKDKSGQPFVVVNVDVNFCDGEQPDVDLRKPDGNIVNTTVNRLLPFYDPEAEETADHQPDEQLEAEMPLQPAGNQPTQPTARKEVEDLELDGPGDDEAEELSDISLDDPARRQSVCERLVNGAMETFAPVERSTAPAASKKEEEEATLFDDSETESDPDDDGIASWTFVDTEEGSSSDGDHTSPAPSSPELRHTAARAPQKAAQAAKKAPQHHHQNKRPQQQRHFTKRAPFQEPRPQVPQQQRYRKHFRQPKPRSLYRGPVPQQQQHRAPPQYQEPRRVPQYRGGQSGQQQQRRRAFNPFHEYEQPVYQQPQTRYRPGPKPRRQPPVYRQQQREDPWGDASGGFGHHPRNSRGSYGRPRQESPFGMGGGFGSLFGDLF